MEEIPCFSCPSCNSDIPLSSVKRKRLQTTPIYSDELSPMPKKLYVGLPLDEDWNFIDESRESSLHSGRNSDSSSTGESKESTECDLALEPTNLVNFFQSQTSSLLAPESVDREDSEPEQEEEQSIILEKIISSFKSSSLEESTEPQQSPVKTTSTMCLQIPVTDLFDCSPDPSDKDDDLELVLPEEHVTEAENLQIVSNTAPPTPTAIAIPLESELAERFKNLPVVRARIKENSEENKENAENKKNAEIKEITEKREHEEKEMNEENAKLEGIAEKRENEEKEMNEENAEIKEIAEKRQHEEKEMNKENAEIKEVAEKRENEEKEITEEKKENEKNKENEVRKKMEEDEGDKGVGNRNNECYPVESVIDFRESYKKKEFLIKWEGWDSEFNSWEDEREIRANATPGLHIHISMFFLNQNILLKADQYLRLFIVRALLKPEFPDCLLLSKFSGVPLQVHKDVVIEPSYADISNMQRLLQQNLKKIYSKWRNSRNLSRCITSMSKRTFALDKLERWRQLVQKKEPRAVIDVLNLVDNETLPEDFVYITEYELSPNIEIHPPSKHCNCESESCFNNGCCGLLEHHSGKCYRSYDSSDCLQKSCRQALLYECNSRCRCGDGCRNRVIQKGIQLSLTIFKTVSRGWGVKTNQKVKQGTFIGSYMGELMTSQEAAEREISTYLFDLGPTGETLYTVDGGRKGNLTRFFNHSCDPNMTVHFAYIENHNPATPQLAFFAKRAINKDEELTFNYNLRVVEDGDSEPSMPCMCGSRNCKKFLV